MNTLRGRVLASLLLVLLLPLSAALAQDDAEPDEKSMSIYVEVGVWGAEPLGLEYEAATADSGGVAGAEIIGMDHEPSYEAYYEAGLVLGKDFGMLRGSWYAQTENSTVAESYPGWFRYGQILSHPLVAGFANDGLADGFDASATTRFSEFRLDLVRPAFRTESIVGTWFFGVRRVTHERDLSANYYALSPELPVLLPPQPQFLPQTEEAQVTSDYTGRGIEVGMEFRMPIWTNRLELETGFAVAALRGSLDSTYTSTNWAYVWNDDGDVDTPGVILTAPYDELSDPAIGAATAQQSYTTRLTSSNRSTVSPVVDMYLGVRGRVWRDLELLLGFRDSYYGDVGVDLRPKVVTATDAGVNVQDVTEVDRSAQYEGAYFSVAYTF